MYHSCIGSEGKFHKAPSNENASLHHLGSSYVFWHHLSENQSWNDFESLAARDSWSVSV